MAVVMLVAGVVGAAYVKTKTDRPIAGVVTVPDSPFSVRTPDGWSAREYVAASDAVGAMLNDPQGRTTTGLVADGPDGARLFVFALPNPTGAEHLGEFPSTIGAVTVESQGEAPHHMGADRYFRGRTTAGGTYRILAHYIAAPNNIVVIGVVDAGDDTIGDVSEQALAEVVESLDTVRSPSAAVDGTG